jgi:site-specific DNA-methyltransferase (adenine-specific)
MKAAWEDYRKVIGHKGGRYNSPGTDIRGGRLIGGKPATMTELGNIHAPATASARQWEGWGTALKPAMEDWWLLRKPLSEKTIAANVQKWGTGSINIDGCRVETSDNLKGGTHCGPLRRREEYSHTDSIPGASPLSRLRRGIGEYIQPSGRWPANLIHDGSEEVLELFPETGNGHWSYKPAKDGGIYKYGLKDMADGGSDRTIASAARFFYCAKASRAEREAGCEGIPLRDGPSDNYGTKAVNLTRNDLGPNEVKKAANVHPCVKPFALMRYLCRLVTPPGGIILDPFMGSGTTGMAAKAEGFEFIGIEKEQEYVAIAGRRIEATA